MLLSHQNSPSFSFVSPSFFLSFFVMPFHSSELKEDCKIMIFNWLKLMSILVRIGTGPFLAVSPGIPDSQESYLVVVPETE